MDPILIGLLGVVGLVLLLLLGMPVVFAAALTGFLGLVTLKGWAVATSIAGILPYDSTASYSLSVLPMFILIGFLAHSAGMVQGAYSFARAWLGWLPGGLGIATIFASAGFGAVSGASTATAAVFSRIAIPELTKRHYSSKMAAALVAASGTLASLIPPSTVLVVYGIIVEQSIGKLLLAGLVPGFFSALLYGLYVAGRFTINPGLGERTESIGWGERVRTVPHFLPIVLVITTIVLGMATGWATPTEAGALGSGIVFLIALLSGRLTLSRLHGSLMETAKLAAMIFATIWGVLILVRFFAFSGLPGAVAEWIIGLDVAPTVILICVLAVYVVLGMFMNAIGMMLLTLPIIFPAMMDLGFDPIWFGILVVKVIEIGLITPPIGLNCFVVTGVRPDIPLNSIFRGVIPFLVIDVFTIALLIIFPGIVLWLPNLATL